MIVKIKRLPVVAIVLLAFLVAALALAACGSESGSSDTSGGTSASTTGANGGGDTETYTDDTYGYSFAYPASWDIQKETDVEVTAGASSAGGVGVFNPAGAKVGDIYIDLMLVSVYKLNVTVDDSNLDEIKTEIEAVLESIESQGTDMQRVEPLAETTEAGMKGYKATYTFSKDGAPCTSTLYFLFDGDMEYQLTTQAATENWEADQPIFDAMIASFKPGQGQ
jgi:hypothetical protein